MSSLRMRRRGVLASFKPPPSLDLNFLATTLDSRITFTRAAGPATYFDSSGTLQSAGSNVARFDFDPVTHAPRGLLIEEARTNSFRNSTMVGAASGTPGTLPTNWTQGNTDGLSVTSLTTGVFNGISCIDLRFTQTVSAGIYTLSFDANNIIAALTGQSWTLSTYIGLVAGSLSNVTSIVYQNVEYTSGGSVVTSSSSSAIIPTATLTRYPAQIAVAGGGTVAFINPRFLVTTTAGAVNFTLRIGAPQIELGAFPTSFVPTTTAAATRAADVATMTLGSWFNAAAGTLAVTALQPVTAGKATTLAAFTGPSGKTGLTVNASNQVAMFDTAGALNTSLGAEPVAATFNAGFAWQAGSQSGSLNGGLPVSAAASALTAGNTTLSLGYDGTSQQPSGYIRRIRYWPRAMGSAELQAVTR